VKFSTFLHELHVFGNECVGCRTCTKKPHTCPSIEELENRTVPSSIGVVGNGGSFSAFPNPIPSFDTYSPFWNGRSLDTVNGYSDGQSNVGYYLTGTGDFAIGNTMRSPEINPSDLQQFVMSGGAADTLEKFVTSAGVGTQLYVTIAGNAATNVVGWYDSNGLHPLFSGSSSAVFTPADGWFDLYLQTARDGTFFSDASLNLNASNQSDYTTEQHFAVFQQTSTGTLWIGEEDLPFSNSDKDYNDVILSLSVRASPTLVTTASPAITLGTTTPTLSDSAVLSGGYHETGRLVFTLSGPGGFSYTQSDTLSGNGTYTASDTLPIAGTAAGTYTWLVTYAGDANNNSAADQASSLEALDASLPIQATEVVTFPAPGNPTPSYFSVALIGGTLTGTYQDWCVDTADFITPGQTYTVDVYSSAGSALPTGVVNMPQNFPEVNWILNQSFVGKTAADGNPYTYSDVQVAIWTLIGTPISSIPTYTQRHVDDIVSQASTLGQDFVPGYGQSVAVILRPVNVDPPAQVTFAVVTTGTAGMGTAEQTVVSPVTIGLPNIPFSLLTQAAPVHPFLPGASVQLPVSVTYTFNMAPFAGVNLFTKGGEEEKLGTITGEVFWDDNGNGVLDPGEEGIPNQLVLLQREGLDGQMETVATTWSDSTGWYIFMDVKPGLYHVRTKLSGDWVQTNKADFEGAYFITMRGGYHFVYKNFGAIPTSLGIGAALVPTPAGEDGSWAVMPGAVHLLIESDDPRDNFFEEWMHGANVSTWGPADRLHVFVGSPAAAEAGREGLAGAENDAWSALALASAVVGVGHAAARAAIDDERKSELDRTNHKGM